MESRTSSLTAAVYHVLHLRTPRPSSRKAMLTYAELISELYPHEGVPKDLVPNDSRLNAALVELTQACRAANLPAISSLVILAGTREPSEAYYTSAHPHATDADTRRAQWQKEADDAALTLYPKRLMELATA